MDPITLEILKNAMCSIPEEMGIALRNTAFSPNIKERMDLSCALFDWGGKMLAQAEHIPVHLGTMHKAVEEVPQMKAEDGDQIIMNDPFRSGTHLPDITLVKPIFFEGKLVGYSANKAHHADIGGITPGSMAGKTTEIWQEGLIIPPVRLLKRGEENKEVMEIILRNTRVPEERIGDLRAQIGANELGGYRLSEFINKYGLGCFKEFTREIIEYSGRVTRKGLSQIPKGNYSATDWMDNDGVSDKRVRIKAKLEVGDKIKVDFEGSAPQQKGNINAPLPVTKSGVYYAFRCLLGEDIPLNEGFYSNIEVNAPKGCLLNPHNSAAVAAGNVETSQRVVDVLFLALAKALPNIIPAQSQGTMNNLSIGNERFAYYETIGGGAGALPYKDGESGIQVHMTNTKNTPVEVIESAYPLRVEKYSIRKGSGGSGKYKGGEGIIRAIRVLEDCTLSIQSERRKLAPKGVKGGRDGLPGKNYLLRKGKSIPLPSKISMEVKGGDVIVIETPGGGGWGKLRE